MAFKMLDEKTMLVTSSEQFPVFPERPEPPRRVPKKLKRAAAAQHIGLSVQDFDRLSREPGFPEKTFIPCTIPGVWGKDEWGFWDTHLEAYRDQQIEKLNELNRLFGGK